jgi:2'-5' RNA ligase
VANVLLAGDESEGQAGGMPARRLQVTIFLPESTGSIVQQVRLRYDPVMAGRVAPHVTLAYEVSDETVLTERLVAACAAAPRFRIRFSGPQCWDGEPDRGIYLPVEDTDRGIAELRGAIIRPPLAEPANLLYQPHLTLVHPRTATVEMRRRAWPELSVWEVPGETVLIDSVTVMGEFDHGWAKIESYRLGSGGGPGVVTTL